MGSVNTEDEVTDPKKDVKIFGRSIAEIPCFRNSFIFGICTGVAGGLIAFMFTSKARFSSHTAFASLWVGVFVYWIPCRYRYESQHLFAENLKKQHNLRVRQIRASDSDSNNSSTEKSNSENEKEK